MIPHMKMDFSENLPGVALFALSFAGIIGLLIGSFYSATASRVLYYFYGPGRKKSTRIRDFFVRPSFCMNCEKQIPRVDLIPIIGYIGVRGRCRYCNTPIGIWTYIGELMPAIALPLLIYSGLPWPSALASILLLGHLYISIATDYNFHLLDHENALFTGGWAILAAWFNGGIDAIIEASMTGVAALLILLSLYFIAGDRRMGFADVILGSILSFFVGFPWALVLFNLAAGGAVIYGFFILKDRTIPIPFGVFLSISAWVTTITHAIFRIWML